VISVQIDRDRERAVATGGVGADVLDDEALLGQRGVECVVDPAGVECHGCLS
jgi:hypothetical protein